LLIHPLEEEAVEDRVGRHISDDQTQPDQGQQQNE
jgi:hypothetical protein